MLTPPSYPPYFAFISVGEEVDGVVLPVEPDRQENDCSVLLWGENAIFSLCMYSPSPLPQAPAPAKYWLTTEYVPVITLINKSARAWKKNHLRFISHQWVVLGSVTQPESMSSVKDVLEKCMAWLILSFFLSLVCCQRLVCIFFFYCYRSCTAMLVKRFTPREYKTRGSSASQIKLTPVASLLFLPFRLLSSSPVSFSWF